MIVDSESVVDELESVELDEPVELLDPLLAVPLAPEVELPLLPELLEFEAELPDELDPEEDADEPSVNVVDELDG